MIAVRVTRDLADLANHAEQWNQLLIGSPQRSPMLSYAWVSSFLEHRLEPGESWYVVLAHEGERLIGVFPVVVTPHRVAGISRPVLRTPNGKHTLGGDALLARDAPDDLLPRLIETAENETPDRFVLELHRVVETSPTLDDTRIRHGRIVHQQLTDRGCYYTIDGTFDDYLKGLSKKFAGNVRKAENQLRKLTTVETAVLEGDAATEQGLEKFMPVEASGWKGTTGSAIQASAELTAFYRTLTRRLSEAGMLRWEFLDGAEGTLAANLSVRFGNVSVVWKLGYDQEHRRYSPGSILFKHILQRAYEENGVTEFNLLTDTPWQKNWKPQRRTYYNLRLYPRGTLPYLFGYLPRRLKDLARRMRGLKQSNPKA